MGVNWSGTRATPRLDLGAAVMEYMDGENGWIGTKALPVFKTQEKEASYTAITRETITKDADVKRAKRANYNRDGFEAEDKTFNCEEYGQEMPLDDGERRLYASDFAGDLVSSKIAARRVMAAQEKRIADLILNTTTFTGATLYTDYSGAPWDTAGSDVLAQINAVKELVRANCGMPANAVIMGRANLERLMLNTGIKNAISYTAIPTYDQMKQALAGLFGVRWILVGDAVRNSANEGLAYVGADIWNEDYVSVARIIENPDDLSEPGLGRTFLWVADSPENVTVEEYREEAIRSDVFRVRHHVDEVLIDSAFAHLMKVD